MTTAAAASTEARAAALLAALDGARTLPTLTGADSSFGLPQAFAVADELRRLRLARGERPLGYKIGFTNRGIWARYGVFAPIWGPIWNTTTERVDRAETVVSLAPFVEPRLEPEVMFGFARAPSAGMDMRTLTACIEWVAHGYEIVHTHFAGWRFAAADTVADFALHGRLFVGPRVAMDRFDATRADAELAALRLTLACNGRDVEEGEASIVLDGPLDALRAWVDAMAVQTPHWSIRAGDIVTTGTITDAAPLHPGERWQTRLSDRRLSGMTLVTTA